MMYLKTILTKNLFTIISVIIFIVFLLLINYLSKYTHYVSMDHFEKVSKYASIAFLSSVFLIGVTELAKGKQSIKDIFSAKHFLIFSLIISLTFSIFAWRVQSYSIGLFVFSVIVYFATYRKIYALNKIYFLIFLYALLNLLGTLTTPKGFTFPEKTYSFYILPIAFCLFNLEKQTLLKIMKVFFRAIFIYCAVTILFWQFNISYLNFSSLVWMTSKINIDPFPGYHFAINWSNFHFHDSLINYAHPSFVSLILNTALITGFYLFYKKNTMAYISKIELVIFAVFSLITQFSMQSRIGVIGFLIITTVSMLYYVKMKTPYFKAILYVGAILAVMLFFIFTKTGVMKATQDRPREISYAFATSYIHDHFWWGCGTGEQQTALHHQDEIMPEVNLLPGFPPYLYSHNQFLGEMVQFGIVGLIVLSTLLIGLIYYSFKTRNYLLQMLMLLYILFMMIEEPLYAQEGIMRFMVFLTFFIAVGKSEKNRKSFSLNNIFSKTKIQG